MAFQQNNAVKYLRKDINYTISFDIDHLIKLESGSNAEVVIKNDKNTYTLSSLNPTVTITGTGYTVKSNKDAMIYLYGKFEGKQYKIEKNEGKIIRIKNLNSHSFIDFGFDG